MFDFENGFLSPHFIILCIDCLYCRKKRFYTAIAFNRIRRSVYCAVISSSEFSAQ